MGKLLRVVVIILLVLSIAALVFGIMLFAKREILKGRTQKLETTIIQLGPVIEAGPATEIPPTSFPAKDISPCAAEVLDSPQKSDFWDKYKIALEVAEAPKMDIRSREHELGSYFKKDQLSGKPEVDGMGQKITSGPGTMQAVLGDLLDNAKKQYDRLNETRAQLKALREEYLATVEDINAQKKTLREKLVYIVQLETKIKELEEKVKQLEAKIQELEAEIKRLQETIAEKDKEIQTLNEKIANKDAEISRLKKEIDEMIGKKGIGVTFAGPIEPGVKGKVVAVDPAWNFVVMRVDEKFMKEMLGQDLSGTVPQGVDLMIRRAGAAGKFVTKVRLMNIRKSEGVAVADILTQWKQGEVLAGDIVMY